MAQLLNDLQSSGLVQGYALFGAMAQMRYTEAVATLDADVLVAVAQADRLDVLGDIYAFCAARGHSPEGEAMEQAETANFDGVPLRVVRAAHLAVIALSVGRAKDFARVLALLESGSVTRQEIGLLATRHGLDGAWERFEGRFPRE